MAKRFGFDMLISQVGYTLKDVSREDQWNSMVQGLKECVPILQKAGVTLIVEPLNHQDHPGYFLTHSKDAFRLIEEVGSENVKILYDIYHYQITEGNLIKTITENIDKIGHFHCAGNPGRGNITEGEINYPEVFRAIKELGYVGYMGLECGMFEKREEGITAAHQLFKNSQK
jgi:hydroxypyruvate isomerase